MSSPTLASKDLRSLLETLQELAPVDDEIMMRLPTFGGEEPTYSDGIWSWDATHLLVGTCAADLRMVPRADSIDSQ